MKSIAVVGGGISGLTAAHVLLGSGAEVCLFEASPRLGGSVQKVELPGGFDLPLAADNFIARRPEMLELAVELGLGESLHAPAARTALIYRDGSLHPIPPGLLGIPTDLDALARSGLISAAGVDRAAQDLSAPDDRPDGDESVGSLVRRRLGDEVLEYVVDPLLGGINAGDSDRLSIMSGVPQIGSARARHRSLVEAARMTRADISDDQPVFLALEGGIESIVAALESSVGDHDAGRIHTDHAVRRLEPVDGRWHVDDEPFDAVVVAIPAYAAARLLGQVVPDLGSGLAGIDYSSVAMTIMILPPGGVPLDPSISGVLVPRLEGKWVTAISVASNKWPGLVSDGHQVLRVSIGRRTDTRWTETDDAEILAHAISDVRHIVGLEAEPIQSVVHRWIDALPQYDVGHGAMIDAIDDELEHSAPGLVLAGAALRGLGLPACVASGRRAAANALASATAPNKLHE